MTARFLREAGPFLVGLGAVSAWLLHWAGASALWPGLMLWVLLLFPAWEDWRTGYLSDHWSLLIGVCGAVHWLWRGNGPDLAAAATVWLFFALLCHWDLLGEGDLWLGSAIALWLSWSECILFLWGAFVIGGLAGLFLVLTERKGLADALPFAPCLCLAGGIAYAWGPVLWSALFG